MNTLFVSPQNSYADVLTPSVIVWGGGAFGRLLGLDENMRMGTS